MMHEVISTALTKEGLKNLSVALDADDKSACKDCDDDETLIYHEAQVVLGFAALAWHILKVREYGDDVTDADVEEITSKVNDLLSLCEECVNV